MHQNIPDPRPENAIDYSIRLTLDLFDNNAGKTSGAQS